MSPKSKSKRRMRRDRIAASGEPPASVGSDEEAVVWVDKCFKDLYASRGAVAFLARNWIEALTEYCKNTGIEVSAVRLIAHVA